MCNFLLTRTNTANAGFNSLIKLLDRELWHELNEDQATYDQYNKVPNIETAVVVYADDEPVACGCFKAYAFNTVEIKRMFVKKTFRGNGLSKMVLLHLESWAKELGYSIAILETSIHFNTARKLYQTSGYNVGANYGPYVGLAESVCMKKDLAD